MSQQMKIGHEAKVLAEYVRRVYATGDAETGLENNIRAIVVEELFEKDELEVTADAMGLINEAEASLLHRIVNRCSTTFYQNKQIVSAISVLVAILWRSRHDRIYTLNRADSVVLDAPAIQVRMRVGAKNVFFGPHLYSGQEFFGSSARDLRNRMHQLILDRSNQLAGATYRTGRIGRSLEPVLVQGIRVL